MIIIDQSSKISPQVTISNDVEIGANCVIGSLIANQYGVIIKEGAKIGSNVVIYPGLKRATIIGNRAVIGDDCTIGEGSHIPDGYSVPPNTYIPDNSIIE